MTTPRPHAEMSALYMSDSTLKCWYWSGFTWVESIRPSWEKPAVYFIGHAASTEPPRKTCTLAGLTFPAPETIAPEAGAACWFAYPDKAYESMWINNTFYTDLLEKGFVHLTEEAAQAHHKAIIAANRLAVERAV